MKLQITIDVQIAELGQMSSLPGVYRSCDRQAWVRHTDGQIQEVKPGDLIITDVKVEAKE